VKPAKKASGSGAQQHLDAQICIQPPSLFYKDAPSAKDFSVVVEVPLSEARSQHPYAIRGDPHALEIKLLYASQEEVDQSSRRILRLTRQPSLTSLDQAKGVAQYAFLARIEDVSKNHQRQRFCLEINAIENGPLCTAPSRLSWKVLTKPIEVKSKLSKSKKSKGSSAGRAAGGGAFDL
jgi:hypothetical protein